ncbi:MAG: sulfotransferase [Alphaproteobacteria bacterium]|nr:sulfotransferase [Alphaproteobacteria bacterium]
MTTLRYPDFLCIGAQKSGTSWLHVNLCNHPRLWLPPLKELHYFDHVWNVRGDKSYRHLVWWWRRSARVAAEIRCHGWPGIERIRWYGRYLSFLSDKWYGNLFPPDSDVRVGEVTPAYSRLDEEGVGHVARLVGNAKVIYILRNPIERSWSAAAMRIRNACGITIDRADETQIWQILGHPSIRKGADYVRHIKLWRRHFGESNVHIAFYDDLCADPRSFLRAILGFLEVEPSGGAITERADTRIGKINNVPISGRYLASLLDLHRDQLFDAHQYLRNRHTAAWLESANGRPEAI